MTPDAKIQIFAIKRGMITNRLDAAFFHLQQETVSNRNVETLGDLCVEEPNYGSSRPAIKKENDKQPNYIRITDFSDFGIEEDHEFVSVADFSPKDILRDKDLLFARTGASVGKTYIHDDRIGFSVFAGYCIRFRFNRERVLPEYVWAYTKTKHFKSWVMRIQRKSGQPNINKQEYKSVQMPCPSVGEQKRMVDSFMNGIRNRANKLRQAGKLLAGMDEFVFNTLRLSPKNKFNMLGFAVHLKHLNGVIDVKRHYNTNQLESRLKIQDIADIVKQKINPQNYPEDVFDWIRIDDLPNQPIDITEIRTECGDAIEGTFFEVRPGDILVARLGPTILNRKTVMVRTIQRRTIASAEFLVLRCKDGFLPEAVMAILKMKFFVDQMYAHARGSTPSRYRLNREDMLNLAFPDITNMQLQQLISREAISRRCQAIELRKSAEKDWQNAREQFEKQLFGE